MAETFRCIGLVFALILLAGCNSSTRGTDASGEVVTTPPPHEPLIYQTLESTENVDSQLSGSSVLLSNNRIEQNILTGSIDHGSARHEIDDGSFTLVDADGFDSSDTLRAGAATLQRSSSFENETFEYVLPFTFDYELNAGSLSSTGVVGIVTQVVDVPMLGLAEYNGGAEGFFSNSSGAYRLVDGTSEVLVDFGAKEVDINLTGFSAVNLVTQQSTSSPVSDITVREASISGNSFTGGDVVFFQGSQEINHGVIQSEGAQGHFYGYDVDQFVPDEVGGVVVKDGALANGYGIFIAD